MKRSIFLAGVLTLALAGFAFAQSNTYGDQNSSQSATSQSQQTVTGTVVSTGDNSVVITTDDGTRMTFTRDSMSGTIPDDVTTGSRITVQYDAPSAGTYHLDSVAMAPATSGSNNAAAEANEASRSAAQSGTSQEAMPRTASPVPLIALAGLLALGTGFGLRLARQRS